MSTRLFALVIGIDIYKSGDIWNLESCVDDAKHITRWLTDGLGVPQEHIRQLLNARATKQHIEDTFSDHLLNNTDIQSGDAIFVYFAGHGSSIKAPSGWYHPPQQHHPVEVLCPYDYDTKSSDGRVAGISDRALHELIYDLSIAKGNNITLMLDCCFSPSQATSMRDRSLIRWTPTTKSLPTDLLSSLPSRVRGRDYQAGFGFLRPGSTTHQMLMACGPNGKAMEGKRGGRFTSAFLQAANVLHLHETSLKSLMGHVAEAVGEDAQPAYHGCDSSSTLFDGIPFTIDPFYFRLSRVEDDRVIRLEHGSNSGITLGKELSVHAHNYRGSPNPSVASLMVTEVHSTWSFARVKCSSNGVPSTEKGYWARFKAKRGRDDPGLIHVRMKRSYSQLMSRGRRAFSPSRSQTTRDSVVEHDIEGTQAKHPARRSTFPTSSTISPLAPALQAI